MCARGGAPAPARYCPPIEGGSKLHHHVGMFALSGTLQRERKECAWVSSPSSLFIPASHFYAYSWKCALWSPWICRMPHSQTKVKERNFNGWGDGSEGEPWHILLSLNNVITQSSGVLTKKLANRWKGTILCEVGYSDLGLLHKTHDVFARIHYIFGKALLKLPFN